MEDVRIDTGRQSQELEGKSETRAPVQRKVCFKKQVTNYDKRWRTNKHSPHWKAKTQRLTVARSQRWDDQK